MKIQTFMLGFSNILTCSDLICKLLNISYKKKTMKEKLKTQNFLQSHKQSHDFVRDSSSKSLHH